MTTFETFPIRRLPRYPNHMVSFHILFKANSLNGVDQSPTERVEGGGSRCRPRVEKGLLYNSDSRDTSDQTLFMKRVAVERQ